MTPYSHQYLFFDTETTGLPLRYDGEIDDVDNWPRVVQLAYQLYGCHPDRESRLLNQGCDIICPDGFEIPEAATKIHGIGQQRALAHGLPIETVLGQFRACLDYTDTLVAHNVSYDYPIVGAEMIRLNYVPPRIGRDYFKMKTLCTKELSTNYCQIPNRNGYAGYKWPSLQELHYKLFGEGFDDAHDALVDVKATAKCFFELQKRNVL